MERSRPSSSTTATHSAGSRSSCTRSSSLEYLQWREQLAELPDAPEVCVTEVPLLYETGGDARFDKVVVITAPEKLRRARSLVATEDREARLIPDAEKVQRADYAFKNIGSLEELDRFVASVMHELAP